VRLSRVAPITKPGGEIDSRGEESSGTDLKRTEEESPQVDALGINGWQLAVQLVAFIVFIFLLWKFAVGPIVNVLDQRQEKIKESFEAAERVQAELKETQARNEDALQQARRESQEIIATARTNSEQLLAAARDEAGKQSDAYLKKAQETLRQEAEQARQQLRQEVADLAVLAASRILRKEIDPKAQAQLIEDTLTEAARDQVSQN
jgi:F-type H+-transporting ATPase subunit b